jgi:hypothetical protein
LNPRKDNIHKKKREQNITNFRPQVLYFRNGRLQWIKKHDKMVVITNNIENRNSGEMVITSYGSQEKTQRKRKR